MVGAVTMEGAIALAEDFLTIAALLGVLWSAIAFVRKIGEDREDARQAKLTAWRKASAQRIMTLSPAFLTTEQITARLRSSSFDAPFDIRKDELTPETVRLLLMELVTDGIFFQQVNDFYGLEQPPVAALHASAAAGFADSAVKEAFRLIMRHPGSYTDDKLYEDVIPAEHREMVKRADFIFALHGLTRSGAAQKTAAGRWEPAGIAGGALATATG